MKPGCCLAIAVSTGVSYTYYKSEEDPDFELSPQDVLDRIPQDYFSLHI